MLSNTELLIEEVIGEVQMTTNVDDSYNILTSEVLRVTAHVMTGSNLMFVWHTEPQTNHQTENKKYVHVKINCKTILTFYDE